MIDHEKLPPGEAPSVEELNQMFVMPFEVEDPPEVVPNEIDPWDWTSGATWVMATCSFIWGVVFTLYLYNAI